MAIRFTAEGGFYEVPDPPKLKRFRYHIVGGPSKTALFSAVKNYPAKKAVFEIAQSTVTESPFEFAFTSPCEVFVSSIRVLLAPMGIGDPITIDKIENHWLGEGFIETPRGFVIVHFGYDVRKHNGSITFEVRESQQA